MDRMSGQQMNDEGERVLELKRWERRKRNEKRAVIGKR